MLKREGCPDAHGWTRSWNSSACPGACFPYTKEKRMLAVSMKQGRIREGPPNKWFWLQLGMSPRIFHSGPPSHKQLAHHNRLGSLLQPFVATALLRKPEGGKCRENTHTEPKNCYWKWGVWLLAAQSQWRVKVVERNVCFISKTSTGGWGRRGLACSEVDSLHWQSRGKSVCRRKEWATYRNSKVSSDLETRYELLW